MPSNNTTPNNDTDTEDDLIELTPRNNAIYAIDHTTGDGCYGSTRADALLNLALKLHAKTYRTPASTEDIEALLNE